MRLAYWNGALWALGNGLVGSQLLTYLAMEFDVPRIGLAIGLVLAAPHLLGVFRLAAPALIGRLAGRKRFCIAAYLLSGLVLAALPAAVAPGRLPSPAASLAALVTLWCVYHLLEYFGTVALWSWLADLAPQAVRGRFFGRRERWMAFGQAAAMLAGAGLLAAWQWYRPDEPRWIGYAATAGLGAALLMAAVIPLARMPAVAARQARPPAASLGALLAPWRDRRLLGLLAFQCWLSFFNGLAQSPQSFYPNEILKLGLPVMLCLSVGLRAGQWLAGPAVGRAADRAGNRPVMAVSMLLIAQGPLFYGLATPQHRWWIIGAWACWIAWVGLNIGVPNLLLKVAPRRADTPYIAAWLAAGGLCHGLSTICGGSLLDHYRDRTFDLLGAEMSYYQAVFLFVWIMQSLGVVLLVWLVREPLAHAKMAAIGLPDTSQS
jgi:MFS family permease